MSLAPADKIAAGFGVKFFLESDAEVTGAFFFEADATADIFSISNVGTTAAAVTPVNIANAAFKLVSATALCTAATSVIAASLLF
jgi:hypothetical protein